MDPDVRSFLLVIVGAGLALLGLGLIVENGVLGSSFEDCGKGGGCREVNAHDQGAAVFVIGFGELGFGVVATLGIAWWMGRDGRRRARNPLRHRAAKGPVGQISANRKSNGP